MPDRDSAAHVWVARWRLEDLGVDLAVGDNVRWSVSPADAAWYEPMLGGEAPHWEVEDLVSASTTEDRVVGTIRSIVAVAPRFQAGAGASAAAAARPIGGTRRRPLRNSADLGAFDASTSVTGFLITTTD